MYNGVKKYENLTFKGIELYTTMIVIYTIIKIYKFVNVYFDKKLRS